MQSSIDLNAIKSIQLNVPESRYGDKGLYVVPESQDITGFFLRASNEQGKVEWSSFKEIVDLTDLKDVTIEFPSNNQTLIWDGQEWINGFPLLSLLEDVNVEGISINSVLVWNGTLWQAQPLSGSGIQNLNGQLGVFQTFNVGTDGNNFNIESSNNNHVFNIPNASSTSRGLLTNTDWQTFNNKLSSSIQNGRIIVGNSSNIATSVLVSGDGTLSNTGLFVLSNTGVTPGVYTNTNITVDSKGRIVDIENGNAGAGFITSINGLTNTNLFITFGTSGNDANVSSATNTITLNIPNASPTSRGLLSSTDWQTFNNKLSPTIASSNFYLGNSSNAAVQVSMSGDGTLSNTGVFTLSDTGVTQGTYGSSTEVSRITVNSKGVLVSASSQVIANTGLQLTFLDGLDVSMTVSSVAPSGNLVMNIPSSSATQRGVLTPQDWQVFNGKLSNLLEDGRIFIGSGLGVPQSVLVSGDGALSNTGVFTLSNTTVLPGAYVLPNVFVDSKGRITNITGSQPLVNNGLLTYNGFSATNSSRLLYSSDVLRLVSGTFVLSDSEIVGETGAEFIIRGGDGLSQDGQQLTIRSGNASNDGGNGGLLSMGSGTAANGISGDVNIFTSLSSLTLHGEGGLTFECGQSQGEPLSSVISGVNLNKVDQLDKFSFTLLAGSVSATTPTDGPDMVIQSGRSNNLGTSDGDIILDVGTGRLVTQLDSFRVVYPNNIPPIVGSFYYISNIQVGEVTMSLNVNATQYNRSIVYNSNGILSNDVNVTIPSPGVISSNQVTTGIVTTTSNLFLQAPEVSGAEDGGNVFISSGSNMTGTGDGGNISIQSGLSISGTIGALVLSAGQSSNLKGSSVLMGQDGGFSINGGVNESGVANPPIGIYGATSSGGVNVNVIKGNDIIIDCGTIDIAGATREAGSVTITGGSNTQNGINGGVTIVAPSGGTGTDGEVRIVQNGRTYIFPKTQASVDDTLSVVDIVGSSYQFGFRKGQRNYLRSSLDAGVINPSTLEYLVFSDVLYSNGVTIVGNYYDIGNDGIFMFDLTITPSGFLSNGDNVTYALVNSTGTDEVGGGRVTFTMVNGVVMQQGSLRCLVDASVPNNNLIELRRISITGQFSMSPEYNNINIYQVA